MLKICGVKLKLLTYRKQLVLMYAQVINYRLPDTLLLVVDKVLFLKIISNGGKS